MSRPAGLLDRIADGVRGDYDRLCARLAALAGRALPAPGLYHYLVGGDGRRRHLHLRIHSDRTALLFINALETIHLSPTDGETAWLVLERLPREEALERLRAAYPDVPAPDLDRILERMARLITRISSANDDCVTCNTGIPQPPPLSVRAQAPYKVDIALTYACNNRCSHCYNEPQRRSMPSLSEEQWERVLERLWDIGVPYVIFTGGDPTMHPAVVALTAHASSLGMIVGMNTNGRRLSEPGYAERLAGAGLDHAQITLASHRAELHDRVVGRPGAFEETVAGIRRALDCGLHTLTNTTLTRDNSAEALDIVDFLHSLGIRTFAMNGMIHSGCGANHPTALDAVEAAPVLARVRERAGELGMRFLWYTPTRYCSFSPLQAGLGIRTCNAAEYSICIEPDGGVLPCQSWYRPVGNILADRWEDIWNSDLFTRIRHRRERPEQAALPAECLRCGQLRVCGGGCLLEQPIGDHEVMTA
ncbi:MAG: radical SAM protein [Armatimonadetes bacterium]|nr:radical SAM protein [Armatimonadota bacterium]